MAPSAAVIVTVAHASEAVATPRPDVICEEDGLQPRSVGPPEIVNNGAVISDAQLAVRITIVELPQSSAAINVLVCERLQPFTVIALVDTSNVGAPQLSDAVATPSVVFNTTGSGLQPRLIVAEPMFNVGGVISTVQMTVLEAVVVLPHASLATNSLV